MKTDWMFIFKAVFACLLSMGIAQRLEIDQPRIAMLTAMVVMQPQAGMVVEKSIYRMTGTVLGCIAAIVLFSLFAQARELLLLGLALWVGACTVGAARYRNHAPYGFILAAYTACIVMMPLVEHPLRVFQVSIDRLAVVSLGVCCAAVVSAVVFPQSSARLLMKQMDERFQAFILFVHDALQGRLDGQAIRHAHLRFVSTVASFESCRSGAFFEDPQIVIMNRRLQRLNADFMHATTRFHALTSLISRMQESDPAAMALRSLYTEVALDLSVHVEAEHIRHIRERLVNHAARWRAQLAPQDTLQEYDTGAELLFRFLGDLEDYALAHAMRGEAPEEGRGKLRYIAKTDRAAALMSGLRATLVILILGAFWIFAEWPGGGAACVFGGTAVTLCAMSPKPQRAARQAVLAGLLIAVNILICTYFILPRIDGFWLLCIAMAPFIAVGPWLQQKPNWVGMGGIYNLFFCFIAGPPNLMHYDPVLYLNTVFSMLAGYGVAALSYLVLVPPDSRWLMRRRMHGLRSLAAAACVRPLKGLAHYFESATRDMLHYMAIGQWSEGARRQQLLDWAFPVMDIGHAVIELRAQVRSEDFPADLREGYTPALKAIAQLFERPAPQSHACAVQQVAQALALTQSHAQATLTQRHALRHALSYLHFIRAALLDMKPFASGEALHAA